MDSGVSDADDWRQHVALATDLLAGRQVQQAVAAARRAVELAPEEPDARLALADALLAVVPRRMRTRAAAFAEIDRAELLGVDVRDLADRRAAPPNPIFRGTVQVLAWLLLAVEPIPSGVNKAIVIAGMVVLVIVAAVVRLRHDGQTFRETLGTKREVARHRLATAEEVRQRAPAAAVASTILVLPAAALSIPATNGDPQSLPLAWLLLGCVVGVGLAAWIGVDRWLRPGTVIRVLRHDAFTAVSVSISFILATASPALAVVKVQRPGLWFALLMAQFAWMAAGVIAGVKLTSSRKKAASQRRE